MGGDQHFFGLTSLKPMEGQNFKKDGHHLQTKITINSKNFHKKANFYLYYTLVFAMYLSLKIIWAYQYWKKFHTNTDTDTRHISGICQGNHYQSINQSIFIFHKVSQSSRLIKTRKVAGSPVECKD